MKFSLKRELYITLQYLLFSLCAATVALYEWDELYRPRLPVPDGVSVCFTTSDWVTEAINHYHPRYLSIFLALSAVRMLGVYMFSKRTRDLP